MGRTVFILQIWTVAFLGSNFLVPSLSHAGQTWNQYTSGDSGCSSCHQAQPVVDTKVPDIGKIYHSCASKEYESCCLKRAKADPKIVYSRNAQGVPTGYYCVNHDHDECLKDTRQVCSNQVNQSVTAFLNNNESPRVRECLSEAVKEQGSRLNVGVLDKVGSAVTNIMSDYYSDAEVANKKKIQFELSYISSSEMIMCLKQKTAQQSAPLYTLRSETLGLNDLVSSIQDQRGAVKAKIAQHAVTHRDATTAAAKANTRKVDALAVVNSAKAAGNNQVAEQAQQEVDVHASEEQRQKEIADKAQADHQAETAHDAQLAAQEKQAAAKIADATCADQAALDQLQAQCQSSTQEAQSSCDTQSNSALQNASALGDQLAASLQGAAATTGACSKVASYSTTMNGAMASFNQTCSNKHQQCQQACSQLDAAIRNSKCSNTILNVYASNLSDWSHVCSILVVKSGTVAAQTQDTIAGIAQAANCSDSTSATAIGIVDCKANPTAPSCVVASTDCSNPQTAATSAVCACSADPNSTACRALSQNSSGSSSSASLSNLAGTGGASIVSNSTGTSPSLSLGPDGAPLDPAIAKKGAEGRGGGAAPGLGGGGGLGSLTPQKSTPDGTNRRGSRLSADILTGTRGFSSTPNSNGRNFGGDPMNRNAKVYEGLRGGPDLRKFLPGGALDPKRGIAGASGPDGLTGPHTDLFAKITNRYHIIEPSLLP